jgi:hypothetical protein
MNLPVPRIRRKKATNFGGRHDSKLCPNCGTPSGGEAGKASFHYGFRGCTHGVDQPAAPIPRGRRMAAAVACVIVGIGSMHIRIGGTRRYCGGAWTGLVPVRTSLHWCRFFRPVGRTALEQYRPEWKSRSDFRSMKLLAKCDPEHFRPERKYSSRTLQPGLCG